MMDGRCGGVEVKEAELKLAMAEARRFLSVARAALDNPPEYDFLGNRHTAAAKRASMDLTRALADCRGRTRS
jgi:hypothetical protein